MSRRHPRDRASNTGWRVDDRDDHQQRHDRPELDRRQHHPDHQRRRHADRRRRGHDVQQQPELHHRRWRHADQRRQHDPGRRPDRRSDAARQPGDDRRQPVRRPARSRSRPWTNTGTLEATGGGAAPEAADRQQHQRHDPGGRPGSTVILGLSGAVPRRSTAARLRPRTAGSSRPRPAPRRRSTA